MPAADASDVPDADEPDAPAGGGVPRPAQRPDVASPALPTPCDEVTPVDGRPLISILPVITGLAKPAAIASPGGDSRLFVVEQDAGRVLVLVPDAVEPTVFLDIGSKVASGGELGLLGIAFHPRYRENGRLFLHYTSSVGGLHSVIAEYTAASPDDDVVSVGSERILLTVAQPTTSNKGGHLAFGPDGYLYIGLGDGGGVGDPNGNAQDLDSLLGKLLRIDVDGELPYAIPSDNPFVDMEGARPEVWAFGLRNPWRFSFDALTGDLYVGDEGQSLFEEVDVLPAGSPGGANLGWNELEASSCYNAAAPTMPLASCDATGTVAPAYEYPRAEGSSVIGGIVYRGCAMPGYHGTYFLGDYGSNWIRRFAYDAGALTSTGEASLVLSRVYSFGTDWRGEIYAVSPNTGTLYKLIPKP